MTLEKQIDKGANKVGLCLAYKGTNYGMLLQAYATQQIVEKFGYKTEVLNVRQNPIDRIPRYIGGYKVIAMILWRWLKNKLFKNHDNLDDKHRTNKKKRIEAADSFRNTKMHDFVTYDGLKALTEATKGFSSVLVGSDQLWLPDVAFSKFYSLQFAAPGVNRISYATSLGVSSYPNYARKAARDFWKKINYLSVREEQGKDIIQSIVDIPVQVVVDPTYLFTKEEWLDRIPNQKITEDGYVLCYFLGDSKPMKDFAVRLAKSKGLRVVSVLSDECNSDDYSVFDEVISGKGPEDFVNLVRNADFVLTDSFHGLAFSVINEKQFLIFYRNRTDTKQSRNSRIDNILNMWGLESRLIIDPENAYISVDQIDYSFVNSRVAEQRDRSIVFLKKALNDETI